MALTIVYKSAHITIQFDDEHRRLTQTWFDFVPSDEFRKAIDFTVSFVSKNEVAVIISDTLKQHAIKPEDAQYATSVMPLLHDAGLKAMAFIIPEDIFTKMALKKFADLGGDYQQKVEYFFNMDDVLNWLKTIENR